MKDLIASPEVLIPEDILIPFYRPDHDHICPGDLADLIPHQLVDRLHLQFGSQSLLHAVNHCQFCVARLGLLKQASVLQGDLHISC